MAMLALKALSLGSEKIPDKAFHAIPGGFFRPEGEPHPFKSKNKKKKKRKDREDSMHDSDRGDADSGDGSKSRSERRRSSHRQSQKSDDYSASESGSDEEATDSKRPQRPTRRNRRYQSSHGLDRGYDSDGLMRNQYQQSRAMPPPAQPGTGQYFPPPPLHAVEDDSNYPPDPNAQYVNTTDGARDDVSRAPEGPNASAGSYFPQQASPAPYPRQPPPEARRPSSVSSTDRYHPAYMPSPQVQQSYAPKRNSVNPGYKPHAGYAEQFVAGYQPSQPSQPSQSYYPSQAGQPQPYQGAIAVQPPVQQHETGYSNVIAPYNMPPARSDPAMNGGYATYYPPQDNWMGSRSPSRSLSPSPDRHRHRHHRSKSRAGRSNRDDEDSRDGSRDRHRGRDNDRSSKSRNRSRSIAAKAKEALKSNRDVASSALGIVAGGLIANQVGHGNKFGTLAGAVLGGFGANMWEKQHVEKKKQLEKREHERDEARETLREKRRQQRRQRDAEQPSITVSRQTRRPNGGIQTRAVDNESTQEQERSAVARGRTRRPYARSNPTTLAPRIISPHVHFASPDSKEFIQPVTTRNIDPTHGLATNQSLMRDVCTQTSHGEDELSHPQRMKGIIKKTIEKEIPSSEKLFQAAKSIKKVAKKGIWDGSVVEEVFMEMTGVSIG